MDISRDHPILITPFNWIGAVVYHTLKRHNYAVAGFCDNNTRLHAQRYDDTPILSAQQAYSDFPDATCIICSLKHAPALTTQLGSLGFAQLLDANDVLDLDPAFSARVDADKAALLAITPALAYALERDLQELQEYYLPPAARRQDAVIFPILEVVVTQRCTLKCKDCANLMQYYQHPQDLDMQTTIQSLHSAMTHTDFVRQLGILGGEPLMHKELPALLDAIGEWHDKIGHANLVSNGTLLPSEAVWQALSRNKIELHISNYGQHSAKREQIVQQAAEHGVTCFVREFDWIDCCKIVDAHARSQEQIQAMYDACCMGCYEIMRSRLYRCPFIAHAHTLGAAPDDAADFVALDDPALSPRVLHEYLHHPEAFPGCAYCSGYYDSSSSVPVEKAAQIAAPLPYKKAE